MSEFRTSLSNLDRGINLFGTLNSYQSRKLNEQILLQHYKSNAQLSSLNRQIEQANSINRKILENQLKEVQKREAQKYYKSLSFYLSEITNELKSVDDDMVLLYTIEKYYAKTKLNIIDAIANCDEIADKTFNKNTLTDLEKLKEKCSLNIENYKNDILYNIDNYIEDYKKIKKDLMTLSKPEIKIQQINISNSNSLLRTIGIVLLSIPILLFLISLIIVIINPPKGDSLWGGFVFLILLFGIPLFALIKYEKKWKKSKKERVNQQKIEIEKIRLDKEKEELEFKEKKQQIEKEMTFHPIHDSMNRIFNEHPKFNEIISTLNNLTSDFDKKWK